MSSELAPVPSVDLAVIDGAVQWLNQAVHLSGLQLAAHVSTYVIDTLLGGDFTQLANRDSHKLASYAALCAHPDLQMGQATLHRLVRIGEQLRHLPPDLAERLSLSHHRALLTIEHVQHKQHMARLAVQHGWTVEELEAHIRAEHPLTGKPRGRPALPPVVKWLGAVQREAADGLPPEAFASHVAQLPAETQAKVRADVAALRSRLQALEAALGPESPGAARLSMWKEWTA